MYIHIYVYVCVRLRVYVYIYLYTYPFTNQVVGMAGIDGCEASLRAVLSPFVSVYACNYAVYIRLHMHIHVLCR